MVHIPAALAESKPVEIVEGTEHLAMSDLSAVVAALRRVQGEMLLWRRKLKRRGIQLLDAEWKPGTESNLD